MEIQQKAKVKQVLNKLASAAALSICFTHLYQYIIGATITYSWPGYFAGLAFGALYFILLYEVYQIIKRSLKVQRFSIKQLILSVLIFVCLSMLLLWVMRAVSMAFFSQQPNPLTGSQERLLYIAVIIVATLYYVFLTFLKLIREVQLVSIQAEKLQRERTQAQINTLKNQISPHFLFNTFNTLSSLIYIEEEETTIQFIQELKKVFRYIMENKHKELVDLKTELDFVKAYFYLLKIRFRDSIQLELSLTDRSYTLFLPPLSLQMLLENAVKHNMFSKSSPLCICVKAEDAYLTITNNRQERKLAEGESMGIGLKNITNRYQLVTAEQVEIDCDKDCYTVKIPLLHHA